MQLSCQLLFQLLPPFNPQLGLENPGSTSQFGRFGYRLPTLLPMLTLFPMLIFVSLPKPGRFPPILGRLILLPEPGKLMFPSGRLIPGQFPPITGRSTLPGNVVGRLMLFVLPSEGRSPLPGRVGRFCPIPVDGRVNGSCELGGLICGRLFELGSEGRVPIEGFEGSVVGREMLGRLPAPPSDGRDPPREAGPLELPPKLAIEDGHSHFRTRVLMDSQLWA